MFLCFYRAIVLRRSMIVRGTVRVLLSLLFGHYWRFFCKLVGIFDIDPSLIARFQLEFFTFVGAGFVNIRLFQVSFVHFIGHSSYLVFGIIGIDDQRIPTIHGIFQFFETQCSIGFSLEQATKNIFLYLQVLERSVGKKIFQWLWYLLTDDFQFGSKGHEFVWKHFLRIRS